MSHRTKRLAVMLLYVWGGLSISTSLPGIAHSAQASHLAISFDDLEAYLKIQSPRAQILSQELLQLQAQRDMELQWSNPALAYDHEEGESLREWQVTLRKRLVMPFSQSQRKEAWVSQIQSAELGRNQSSADLLAELKAGYVNLRLLDAFLNHLDQLDEIVAGASTTAKTRHNEGDISGIENHLIQLAAFSLSAHRRDALQERQELASLWRSEMGIEPRTEIDLVTTVFFQPVELATADEYMNTLEQRPAIQSRVVLQQALGKHAAAAQPDLVPELDIFAGYKRFEDENDGFVAGVALSLPIFDRNAAISRQYMAQQRIVENKLDLYRTRIIAEVETLVSLINGTQQSLTAIPIRLDDGIPMMSNLLYLYQDGRLTLDAFLNALQIEMSGYQDYYNQLGTFYYNIFRLEAITGTQIVSFERQE